MYRKIRKEISYVLFKCFVPKEPRFSYTLTLLLSTLNLQNIRTTSRTYRFIFSMYLKTI